MWIPGGLFHEVKLWCKRLQVPIIQFFKFFVFNRGFKQYPQLVGSYGVENDWLQFLKPCGAERKVQMFIMIYILLMEEILHLLICSVSHIILYRVLHIPGGAGFLASAVSLEVLKKSFGPVLWQSFAPKVLGHCLVGGWTKPSERC